MKIRWESNVNTNNLLMLSIEKLSESVRYLTYINVHFLLTQFLILHVTAVVNIKLRQNHNIYLLWKTLFHL